MTHSSRCNDKQERPSEKLQSPENGGPYVSCATPYCSRNVWLLGCPSQVAKRAPRQCQGNPPPRNSAGSLKGHSWTPNGRKASQSQS